MSALFLLSLACYVSSGANKCDFSQRNLTEDPPPSPPPIRRAAAAAAGKEREGSVELRSVAGVSYTPDEKVNGVIAE